MGTEKLLTVREAAQMLRMSEGWVYSSSLPVVRLGSSRRYRLADVQAYIAKRIER